MGALIAGNVQMQLAPWKADCQNSGASAPLNCGVPAPAAASSSLMQALEPVFEPGQAGRTVSDFIAGPLRGRITLYSVAPPAAQQLPPYVQLRLEVTAPSRALCLQSIRFKEGMEYPPLICAAPLTGPDGRISQWGLTLSPHMAPALR